MSAWANNRDLLNGKKNKRLKMLRGGVVDIFPVDVISEKVTFHGWAIEIIHHLRGQKTLNPISSHQPESPSSSRAKNLRRAHHNQNIQNWFTQVMCVATSSFSDCSLYVSCAWVLLNGIICVHLVIIVSFVWGSSWLFFCFLFMILSL